MLIEMLGTTVIIPNWNGERWLPGCLDSIAAQSVQPEQVIVVDNGSTDRSLELLADSYPTVKVVAFDRNYGFAAAANRGIEFADSQAVALINTDVELEARWLAQLSAALASDARLGSVACKMLDLQDLTLIYDAGNFLRRDGVCEQRGRFERDSGQFDRSEEIFSACAGAALYRRSAVLAVGGFDERFFAYLEDVDLGLRLQLAGWRCHYEPAVACHAGGGSSAALERPITSWVERNTLLLVAKFFPWRWLPYVAYRQLAWFFHAAKEGSLIDCLRGKLAALPKLPAMLRERKRSGSAQVPIGQVIPVRPLRQATLRSS